MGILRYRQSVTSGEYEKENHVLQLVFTKNRFRLTLTPPVANWR